MAKAIRFAGKPAVWSCPNAGDDRMTRLTAIEPAEAGAILRTAFKMDYADITRGEK